MQKSLKAQDWIRIFLGFLLGVAVTLIAMQMTNGEIFQGNLGKTSPVKTPVSKTTVPTKKTLINTSLYEPNDSTTPADTSTSSSTYPLCFDIVDGEAVPCDTLPETIQPEPTRVPADDSATPASVGCYVIVDGEPVLCDTLPETIQPEPTRVPADDSATPTSASVGCYVIVDGEPVLCDTLDTNPYLFPLGPAF